MARLMSQVKMGYYPTPEEVLIDIASKFELKNGLGCSILDPCCGEGDALKILKENIDGGYLIRTYGIELDRNRYLKAKKNVDHIMNADALNEVMIEEDKFSLLFLNPPYDDGELDENDKRERLEIAFLKTYTDKLYSTSFQDGAYLVYIIPFYSLRFAVSYLEAHYISIYVEPFPEDLYKEFKQVVVYAKRESLYYDIDKVNEKIEKLKATDPNDYEAVKSVLEEVYPPTIYERLGRKRELAGTNDIKLFKKVSLKADDMYEIAKSTNLVDKVIRKYEKKDIKTKITPLTNLRKGHLAMLIAAGYLNGDIEKDGKKYTIKGVINRREISDSEEVYKDDEVIEQKTIITTKYDININVYDYQENEFYTIK